MIWLNITSTSIKTLSILTQSHLNINRNAVANARKNKILYIDDKNNNLVGFKASFRLDYNILVPKNTADPGWHP